MGGEPRRKRRNGLPLFPLLTSYVLSREKHILCCINVYCFRLLRSYCARPVCVNCNSCCVHSFVGSWQLSSSSAFMEEVGRWYQVIKGVAINQGPGPPRQP